VSPVAVNELTTEVHTEERPTPAAAPVEPGPPWEELERVRRAHAELARDRARTRAEGQDA
jgi:hypothetical protein